MTTPADTLPTTLYDAGAHAGAVAHICTLLAEGRHTLQACCAAAAIAEDDFRAWAAAPGPVQALYLAARHTADHRFLADALLAARTGLLRLLNPTELDEDETVETTFDKEGRPTGEKAQAEPHPLRTPPRHRGLCPGRLAGRAVRQANPCARSPCHIARHRPLCPFEP